MTSDLSETRPPATPAGDGRHDAVAPPLALGEALAAALFREAPFSVALYDTAGRVAAANAAYERHWGIRVADVPPDYSLLTDPQLADGGLLPLVRRAYDGETVVLPPVRYDAARATGGSGRAVWTQGYCYPVRDAGGAVAYVAIVVTDVTAQAEVEAALEAANADLAARNAQLQEQGLERELSNQQLQDQAAELEASNEELQRATDALAQARDAAEAERTRLDRVVAQLPAGVAVMEGPDLRFRATSAAYRQIIGGRDVVGRPIREALPELSGGEGGADFFALLEGVYATGERVVGTGVPAAWDGDGDGVPEDHMVDLVYAPLWGAGGAVEGVMALVLDVSARVHAEAAVRESEARFRNVADAAPVMLWVTDAGGSCTFLNREWLTFTGQTLDDGLGLGWLDAVHPDDAAEAGRVFLDANARHAPFRLDYRLRRHDGEYRWAVDAAAPRLGPGGEFLGYIGSVTDIDERARLLDAERRARAEAETARVEAEGARAVAEAANRAKGEFLTVMSHELRTPLNAIGGYAELLELGLRGPLTEAQRADLARLRRANHHLTTLVTDVLNFARLEAGQVVFDVEDVEVGWVVADVEALVAPQIAAKGLAFDDGAGAPEAPRRSHRVRADAEKLRQILLNLITNAVKFTDPGGRVALACESDAAAGVVRVRVADTGRGIPTDQLERIFEPFVQVDRRLTHESQQGLGLGLAISRDLARGMGGDVTAESTPGLGSTFTLTLPRA